MNRPDWDNYFLNIAAVVATRATCLRRRYGAVVVSEHHQILSTGYCGMPRGYDDCLQLKQCWRQEHNIPSGQNYDKCYSVHAEENAIIQAARVGTAVEGAVMFLWGMDDKGTAVVTKPCLLCAKVLVNTGIQYVVTAEPNPVEVGLIIIHKTPAEYFEERLAEVSMLVPLVSK